MPARFSGGARAGTASWLASVALCGGLALGALCAHSCVCLPGCTRVRVRLCVRTVARLAGPWRPAHLFPQRAALRTRPPVFWQRRESKRRPPVCGLMATPAVRPPLSWPCRLRVPSDILLHPATRPPPLPTPRSPHPRFEVGRRSLAHSTTPQLCSPTPTTIPPRPTAAHLYHHCACLPLLLTSRPNRVQLQTTSARRHTC